MHAAGIAEVLAKGNWTGRARAQLRPSRDALQVAVLSTGSMQHQAGAAQAAQSLLRPEQYSLLELSLHMHKSDATGQR
jgi:hypothetical protein